MARHRSPAPAPARLASWLAALALLAALAPRPAPADEHEGDAAATWERLRDAASPARIAEALTAHGTSGRSLLRQKLGDPDPAGRRLAADVLGHLGAGDPSVIGALADAVHDDDAAVRRAAALALARLASPTEEARNALAARVADEADGVRLAVHLARLRYAPVGSAQRRDILLVPAAPASLAPLLADAAEVVTRLVGELLDHPSWRVRARALGEVRAFVDSGEAGNVDELIAHAARLALEDASPVVRRKAAETLCRLARTGARLPFQALVPLLDDSRVATRPLVLGVFAWRPEAADRCVADLLHCLASGHEAERRLAALALREQTAPRVLAALQGRLDDPDASVRLAAAVALAGADLDDPRVAELLGATVLDTGAWLGGRGSEVLAMRGLGGRGGLRGTCEPSLRRMAGPALEQLGPAATPALVRLVSSEAPWRRTGSLVLLHHALPPGDAAPLATFLDHDEADVRVTAAALLSLRGALDDRTAAPLLQALGEAGQGDDAPLGLGGLDPVGTARLALARAGPESVPFLLEAARADLATRPETRRLAEIARLLRTIDAAQEAIAAEAATGSALGRWLQENGLAGR